MAILLGAIRAPESMIQKFAVKQNSN